MTTTPARMFQRRRTDAQWTAENPVLAASEVGVVTAAAGAGPMPMFKIGDGTTAWTSLQYTAQYERVTFVCDQMRADPGGAATAGNTLNYPGWDFSDAATQAVQFPWAIPRVGTLPGTTSAVFWTHYSVALIWVQLAGSTGNVRWQVQIRNLSINLDAVNETPEVDVTVTAPVPGTINFLTATVPVASQLPNQAAFGSEYSMRIARLPLDALDTFVGSVRLGLVSLNRVV